MVTSNYVKVGDRTLIKHESDSGFMIRQVETGREYSSAVDTVPCRYTYEETEKTIKSVESGGETVAKAHIKQPHPIASLCCAVIFLYSLSVIIFPQFLHIYISL